MLKVKNLMGNKKFSRWIFKQVRTHRAKLIVSNSTLHDPLKNLNLEILGF